MTTGHRVTWFNPDRPVGGGTIYIRPSYPRRRFTAVPISDEARNHVPADYLDRLASYEENAGHARAWPIRPTRCGEHPGLYGDVEPTRLNSVLR